MLLLICGLVVFLGMHSVHMVAPAWRARQIAALGEGGWKGVFSLVSAIGLVLIVTGFGGARMQPYLLYSPPAWLRHANALFMLVAFVLVAAAYVPGNHLKARLGHPMLAGVKAWAFGHLLATGMVHDLVLFGPFLLWAALDFAMSRRRDRAAGTLYPAGTARGDVAAVAIGAIAWIGMAAWLHRILIGVPALGA
ncbi:NnrUfamily protein [Gluconacetobacter diazotrophicus PA1 5]|uniref:NnrU family protein n=2 Tax=Gluconacetobacter diazotrophicus TaxID=33996 RepID=A0A7W4I3L9_GLUDI|nr:NnrU family protein [Gluconacetobacter diazotrophicus]ACI51213.1 NnrUfamily protein [Gluconacetobacter diazotrophicus PA1 5]MBB2155074.1 NnrU family protein [Gluconacetobacter diazotrophicus]TWB09769.1 putative membrane protein [Gluconacetobacter diazotrophicus]CAP54509.1 putative nitrate reductase protein [Gluconacetobacter diazotrophicus PA1 5]